MGYPAGNRPAASPSDGTGAGSAVPLPAGGADLAGDGGLQPKGGRGSPFLVPGGEGAAHGGGHGLRPSGRAAQHRGTHPGGGPLRHLSPHGRIFPGRLPPPGGGIGHGHGEKRGLRGRRPGGAGSRSRRFRSHRRRYNRPLLPPALSCGCIPARRPSPAPSARTDLAAVGISATRRRINRFGGGGGPGLDPAAFLSPSV